MLCNNCLHKPFFSYIWFDTYEVLMWRHCYDFGFLSHRLMAVIWHSSCLWALRHASHNDVIKWKHYPRYWPFVRGIHRSPVNSQHKGQWRGALVFSLICAWINGWANSRMAGDLRRHRSHCDVTVMVFTWHHSRITWSWEVINRNVCPLHLDHISGVIIVKTNRPVYF